jgi:hypothetical protein
MKSDSWILGTRLLLPLFLAWNYAVNSNIVFEVWHSSDLVNWSELAETQNTSITVGGQPQEFFRVRARDLKTGLTSDWATVQ